MALENCDEVDMARTLESLIGSQILGARGLVYKPAGESEPPMRTAVRLELSGGCAVISAASDTDTILVELGKTNQHRAEAVQDYREEDLSNSEPFRGFINLQVRNWWFIENDAGMRDGFMLAFEPGSGLSFIAIASQVSVQLVRGEQFS